MRKFEEQYERVIRWYSRFKEINDGKLHNRNTEFDVDDVYSFFINCYHLKDWIKHDDTVDKNVKTRLGIFMKNDDYMKLCGKICNGIKHLIIDENIPEFGGKHFDYTIPNHIIKIKFNIETKDGTIDAFNIATILVGKWNDFLKRELNWKSPS
jgi:UDP-galactopyranose mutase